MVFSYFRKMMGVSLMKTSTIWIIVAATILLSFRPNLSTAYTTNLISAENNLQLTAGNSFTLNYNVASVLSNYAEYNVLSSTLMVNFTDTTANWYYVEPHYVRIPAKDSFMGLPIFNPGPNNIYNTVNPADYGERYYFALVAEWYYAREYHIEIREDSDVVSFQSGGSNIGNVQKSAFEIGPMELFNWTIDAYTAQEFVYATDNMIHGIGYTGLTNDDTFQFKTDFMPIISSVGMISISGYVDLGQNFLFQDASLILNLEKATNQVPEPSTFLLIGLGLGGIALLRKKSKK